MLSSVQQCCASIHMSSCLEETHHRRSWSHLQVLHRDRKPKGLIRYKGYKVCMTECCFVYMNYRGICSWIMSLLNFKWSIKGQLQWWGETQHEIWASLICLFCTFMLLVLINMVVFLRLLCFMKDLFPLEPCYFGETGAWNVYLKSFSVICFPCGLPPSSFFFDFKKNKRLPNKHYFLFKFFSMKFHHISIHALLLDYDNNN